MREIGGHARVPALPSALMVALMSVTLAGCGSPSANPLELPALGASGAGQPGAAGSALPGGAAAGQAGNGSLGQGSLGQGSLGQLGQGSNGQGSLGQGSDGAATFGGAGARLGQLTGTARAHPNLVDAVVAYMSVRVQIGNTWQIDEPALDRVAIGNAAQAARDRADQMRSGGRRVVGTFVVNASKATSSGNAATVTGCMVDATSEVDAGGQVVIDPPGGELVTMTLARSAGEWRVSDVPHAVPPFCSAGA